MFWRSRLLRSSWFICKEIIRDFAGKPKSVDNVLSNIVVRIRSRVKLLFFGEISIPKANWPMVELGSQSVQLTRLDPLGHYGLGYLLQTPVTESSRDISPWSTSISDYKCLGAYNISRCKTPRGAKHLGIILPRIYINCHNILIRLGKNSLKYIGRCLNIFCYPLWTMSMIYGLRFKSRTLNHRQKVSIPNISR